MQNTHIFGIRHHGPGCARSLLHALEVLQPDCLLVEGPPDGAEVLPFVLDAQLEPPVALLVHAVDDSARAAFYPFAVFSPEWQALRYALGRGIATRFIDLPQSIQFALEKSEELESGEADKTAEKTTEKENTIEERDSEDVKENDENDVTEAGAHSDVRHDPLGWLGRAAGYADGESWWNHMVEERGDGADLFAAIREAMVAVRSETSTTNTNSHEQRREALREAHMRKCIREAQKEGFTRIAVVCGAWHVPALENLPPAKADNELLKALPKVKVAATWVPWSNGNLSYASGYGAGVDSPGWYEHLWRHTDRQRGLIGWLAKTARLFREEDMDCSSAHLIEAVRLAEALAAMRQRPSAGLDELNEAIRTVICLGDDTPMRLIHRRLVVGEKLGQVPPGVPTLPVQRDLEQQQKSLRLKPEALQKTLDLDLRQPNDLARSHLLHRLKLLDIGWGVLANSERGAKGTFHELWTLQWQPELALAVVNASRWGNTVAEAASTRATSIALNAAALPVLCQLVDQVLLANLPEATTPVIDALENLAAVASDASQLLEAIPSLANVVRYGNVRHTDAAIVQPVLAGMIGRAAIGLSGACASLDDDAAEAMNRRIAAAHQAIRLVATDAQRDEWMQALARVAQLSGAHGMVCGLAARLLFDAQTDALEVTAQRMSQALSIGNEPAIAAAWLEGFLNQSSMVLLHDERLWILVNDWVASLTEAHFMRVLPLVRRTFAAFNAPERRQLGEKAQRNANVSTSFTEAETQTDIDWARAERVLPLLRQILGLPK